MTDTVDTATTGAPPRIGTSVPRPDGVPKVRGRFAFGSDLWADGALFGRTVRSPHAAARIRAVRVGPALAVPGVYAVLIAEDVPGEAHYGLDRADQPVFASEVIRYQGEAVAAIAADHPETARRAAAALEVDYEPMDPLIDAEAALEAAPIHPFGNLFRELVVRHGDPDAHGEVVVEGTYEVGMQDQAFMGPESGMAVPAEDGGVDLYVSTQWLHSDRDQVAACLGLAPEQVRLTLAGVGGAFGAREDLSLHVHACLLALRTGRPVRMSYTRVESFVGHVHRHPARMHYRHEADRDGRLVRVDARLLLDGGAYQSSSAAVLANATCLAAGPYLVPNGVIDGKVVRTNNPPCGAMRGFGAVQSTFAVESQMDQLAHALGLDPVEVRLRNVLKPGDTLLTGQVITGAAPVAELLRACAEHPLPPPPDGDALDRPGGAGLTTDAEDVRRGVGYAVGFKNLMFSEGFDDYSTASCRLENGVVTVTCACAEVGQGFVTLVRQIAHEVLGVDDVVLGPVDTAIGSAGSTSASRQTWMSGGAVHAACLAVKRRIDAGDTGVIEEEVTFRHAATSLLDEDGQGDAHVSFAFAAHRAVVDVDPALGLVKVVDMTTAQDVGRVLNPLQVVGQIEGGTLQGVGLAVMEEMKLSAGQVLNPTFTDYLIPTALDAPEVRIAALVEEPEPGAPFGAKGVGEPPTLSSTPAVAAAIRAATGRALPRVPIRPEDICL